ncbi:MAG: LPS export ABC transporter permease LptG [Fimbriimonadaceae bacterium]|nr:LPS export ABC transporter permease LptG [Alphaproteobacteria bacterium]
MPTLPITLNFYIFRKFTITVIGTFLGCSVLIFLVDFVELLRRSASNEDIGIMTLVYISVIKIPSMIEQMFPFAVLIGSIIAYLALSRKSELVVARSVGVSVWQFMAPAIVSTILLGLIAITVYNPISASLKEKHTELVANMLGETGEIAFTASQSGVWLRQDGVDGQTVIRAGSTSNQGETLNQVTFFTFDHEGAFIERIEATSAILKQGIWELSDVWVISSESPPQFYENFLISTYLTKTQVQESFSDPETISFWQLPRFIATAERAGLKATRYKMQYQTLLARPLFLCAMVLIAATVSLRNFRYGNIERMIIIGIVAGFILFVVTKLLNDLGSSGVLNPVLAAWAPGAIGMLAAISILLYQEDG